MVDLSSDLVPKHLKKGHKSILGNRRFTFFLGPIMQKIDYKN